MTCALKAKVGIYTLLYGIVFFLFGENLYGILLFSLLFKNVIVPLCNGKVQWAWVPLDGEACMQMGHLRANAIGHLGAS